jgi:hypothetical protein
MLKLKDFGTAARAIGIACILLSLITDGANVPLACVVMITVGYAASALSCDKPLLSPSMEHHKIVNYFIAVLGLIVIAKQYPWPRF